MWGGGGGARGNTRGSAQKRYLFQVGGWRDIKGVRISSFYELKYRKELGSKVPVSHPVNKKCSAHRRLIFERPFLTKRCGDVVEILNLDMCLGTDHYFSQKEIILKLFKNYFSARVIWLCACVRYCRPRGWCSSVSLAIFVYYFSGGGGGGEGGGQSSFFPKAPSCKHFLMFVFYSAFFSGAKNI